MPIASTGAAHSPLFSSKRQRDYSLLLLAILVVFYGGLFALWNAGSPVYASVFRFMGIRPWVAPFLDLGGTLSWGDCHHSGVDVFRTNPCDPYGRLFNYSPFLLDLPMHWIGTRNLTVAGVVHDLAFLVMVPLVFRPDSRRTLGIAVAAGLSPAVLFGMERANLDLFVFALVGFGALLATRGRAQRVLSYLLFAVAGLLKLYPFVLLASVVRERRRWALVVGAVAVVGVGAFTLHYWDELVRVRPNLPVPAFGDMFGAVLLPALVDRVPGFSAIPRGTLLVAFAAIATVGAVRLMRRMRRSFPPVDWNTPTLTLLSTGALLTLGCFFAGPSAAYRAAMLVFVIPGVLELRSVARDRAVSRVLTFAFATTMFVLWNELFRNDVDRIGRLAHLSPVPVATSFFFVRELAWWGLITVLGALAALFVVQSPMWQSGWRPLTSPVEGSAETR